MNRRRALATLGGVATTLAGYGALRVGDVRPYEPELGLPDGSANERVIAAARRLHAVDHRALIEVSVLDDGTDGAPYPSTRYLRVHEHSRRRQAAVFTTLRVPPGEPAPTTGGLYAHLHGSYAANSDRPLPVSSVIHVTDGTVLADWTADTPESADGVPEFDGADTARGANYGGRTLSFGEYVLPHRAEWRETDREDGDSGETITYLLDDRDGYAQVPPLTYAAEVHEGSRIAATLDVETGLLRSLHDHRVATKRVRDGEGGTTTRQFTYRIGTTFDRYGEASAPRPAGAPRGALDTRGAELYEDLRTY
ncbi:hypothetical protein HUG10_06595 [Halorarum halophilum]|uniref:Uncharacterized protein n=1 Tax=Halorarum halophilum TaxID=2743090 RepID=A0A7D5GH18_9EURY|nr:hypothetical protein [Halobaculum halophilum]QLG27231.1 hypothetical protein HUG10_06595 [Halobaculum halophilum]